MSMEGGEAMLKSLKERNNDYILLKIKMFNTVATGALLIAVFSIIYSLFSGFQVYTWIFSLLCAILLTGLIVVINIIGNYDLGTVLLSIAVNLLVFPSIFFTNGGISGAVPLYFMIGIVFSIVVLNGYVLYIITFIEILFYVFLFILTLNHPEFAPAIDSTCLRILHLSFGLVFASMIAGSIFRNIIKQNSKERARIDNLLKKDPLTKLYNRRYLMDVLNYFIAHENTYPLTIILFDIDDFKNVNDKYGHIEGDNVLVKFGQVLLKVSNDFVIASRYGGEEFLVVFPGFDKDEALQVGNKISELTRHEVGISSRVTVSGGIATYEKGQTIEQFINVADANLYIAKNQGKNRIVK